LIQQHINLSLKVLNCTVFNLQ